MATISTLHSAKIEKNDEFYTRMEDIKKECNNYSAQFRDKVIYCNCDDPVSSNFFQYFAVNFSRFGLKKLICTCYDKANSGTHEISLWENTENELSIPVSKGGAYKIVLPDALEDLDGDDVVTDNDLYLLIKNDIESGEFKYVDFLEGNGDFRSDECVKLLKEADIIITNPPFSLFREFIALLEKYEKKYLVIGNPNSITYKEIFPLIKENKLWLGYKSQGTDMYFTTTPEYKEFLIQNKKEDSAYKYVNGEFVARAQAIWFTNLDTRKRHEELFCYRKYNPVDYPTYDNYDAIEVSKVDNIPEDYDGIMGVPITFLDKYNPNQFEIIGIMSGAKGESFLNGNDGNPKFTLNGDGVYARILIRRKK